MRLPRRRHRVPDEVRAAVRLAPTERVLAASDSSPGTVLLATDRALYAVTPPQVTRWRWDLIDRAVWEPPHLQLDVRPDEQAAATREVCPVDLAGELPAVVRDRVENSIVVNSRVEVAGGYARVLARRNPDTGRLQWRVVFGPGVDAADAGVQAAAQAELAELRSRLGV